MWSACRAVDTEKHSVAVSSADVLVRTCLCCAPPFECDRVGKVWSLCCCPFRFPRSHLHTTPGDVCCCIHLSGRAGFSQTAARSVRTLRSPASRSLGLRRIDDSLLDSFWDCILSRPRGLDRRVSMRCSLSVRSSVEASITSPLSPLRDPEFTAWERCNEIASYLLSSWCFEFE